jgi:hypothetical protein
MFTDGSVKGAKVITTRNTFYRSDFECNVTTRTVAISHTDYSDAGIERDVFSDADFDVVGSANSESSLTELCRKAAENVRNCFQGGLPSRDRKRRDEVSSTSGTSVDC